MGMFSGIFGLGGISGYASYQGCQEQPDAYMQKLNEMLAAKAEEQIKRAQFDSEMRQQQEKFKGRIIEGEFEVIKGESEC